MLAEYPQSASTCMNCLSLSRDLGLDEAAQSDIRTTCYSCIQVGVLDCGATQAAPELPLHIVGLTW